MHAAKISYFLTGIDSSYVNYIGYLIGKIYLQFFPPDC